MAACSIIWAAHFLEVVVQPDFRGTVTPSWLTSGNWQFGRGIVNIVNICCKGRRAPPMSFGNATRMATSRASTTSRWWAGLTRKDPALSAPGLLTSAMRKLCARDLRFKAKGKPER